MEEMVKYLVEKGFKDYEAEKVLSNISHDATKVDILMKAMKLYLDDMAFADEEIEEVLSDISDDDTREEITERALIKHLENQGLTKDEADEALSEFIRSHDINDIDFSFEMDVEKIYDSLYALADHYVENLSEPLDGFILASLDYNELGRQIVEEVEGYFLLDSGRVAIFERIDI